MALRKDMNAEVEEEQDIPGSVKIGYPVTCVYVGGMKSLGKRGTNFRIKDGKLGHGAYTLSHGIPLSDVASVEVIERQVGKAKVGATLALGAVGALAGKSSKTQTDIIVRAKDGQQANWQVHQRGAAWVRGKLSPVLHEAGVPFHDDAPQVVVQAVTTPVAPQVSTPVPPPPGTPAGWLADLSGHHEQRYWDGSRWTEHVSTAGEQTTDFL